MNEFIRVQVETKDINGERFTANVLIKIDTICELEEHKYGTTILTKFGEVQVTNSLDDITTQMGMLLQKAAPPAINTKAFLHAINNMVILVENAIQDSKIANDECRTMFNRGRLSALCEISKMVREWQE